MPELPRRSTRSKPIDIDNRLGKFPRGFLRQAVTYAARDMSVFIPAGELPGIRTEVRMRGRIAIAFHGDGGYSDGRCKRTKTRAMAC
jgi:hypothetical protein